MSNFLFYLRGIAFSSFVSTFRIRTKEMKNTSLKRFVSVCLLTAFFGAGLQSLRADIVVVGTAGTSSDHSPGYSDSFAGATSTTGGFTTITGKSTATNPVPYAGTTYRYNGGGGTLDVNPWISLSPPLAPDPGPTVYRVYGTRAVDTSATTDSVFAIQYTGCTGMNATTTFFRQGGATLNGWKLITTIKLDSGVTTPTVKFVKHLGTTATTGNCRTHSDSFYFKQLQCSDTANVGGISTIAQDATSVTVTGCSTSTNLEKVSIYDGNDVLLGENTSPVKTGTVVVSGLAPLASGTVVKAVQTIFGVESCLNTAVTATVADPCASVANVGGISGTVYNDASTITVTGCNTSASEVRVYDTTSSSLMGFNSSPNGLATVVVNVSGLVQGHTVKAVQVLGGQESCLNTAPSKVVQGPICTSVATIAGPFLGPIDMVSQIVGIKGISTSATNICIYQDDVLVGRKTVSNATNAFVSCVGLFKGSVIKATQMINGQESCLSSAPSYPSVGTGTPSVRLAIGLRNTATAASPLGFDGGQTGTLYCLGANGGGTIAQHTPPTGIPAKNIVASGSGWQTISFSNGVDPSFNYTANTVVSPVPGNTDANGTWAVLEGLYIVPDDPNDTGAYNIYIDNIKNGSTVYEDFESRAIGKTSAAFGVPNFSSTTGPNLLGGSTFASPNVNIVTNNYADTGTKCAVVKFQFTDTSAGNWVRLTTAGSTTGANPSFDISQPISMRVMLVRTFSARINGDRVILDWYGTNNLESKASLNQANWDPTGITTGPYTNILNGPAKFFRLHNQ